MYYRLILFIIFIFHSTVSFAILLDSVLDSIISDKLASSNFAIVVKDPDTETILYQHNAHKYLSPASNTKLFPAAAALLALGQDYRYKTEFGYDKKKLKNKVLHGNLYIRFNGDPSLTDSDIEKILAKLDIRQINGHIIIDKSRFGLPDLPSGTSYDDIGWYYAAPSSAIIINENAFKVLFQAKTWGNKLLKIKPAENSYGIKIKSLAKTVPEKFADTSCDLVVKQKSVDEINVFGCWSQKKKARFERFAVPDPLWWAKQILRSKLKKNNIRFHGKINSGTWPKKIKIQLVHYSAKLEVLLKHMLYDSDNLYADSIAKTIAAKLTQIGTYKKASYLIKKVIKQQLDVNLDDVILADGSGTRYNLMTASEIAMLLNGIYKEPRIMTAFINALPLSGKRGSLKDRMADEDLKGKIFAKTGTMHDISSLAGYIVLPNNKILIFAMIANHYPGRIEHLKQVEDTIVRAIWGNA